MSAWRVRRWAIAAWVGLESSRREGPRLTQSASATLSGVFGCEVAQVDEHSHAIMRHGPIVGEKANTAMVVLRNSARPHERDKPLALQLTYKVIHGGVTANNLGWTR